MYTFLAIFIISIGGMTVLVGRKLAEIKKRDLSFQFEIPHPLATDIEKVKHIARKKAKRYSYIALFITLRLYIQASNYLKNKSVLLAQKIKEKLLNEEKKFESLEHREVAKYLKMISEYRQKIRRMKRQIRKEEGLE